MINYTDITFQELKQITHSKLGFCNVKFSELETVVRFTARAEEKTDPLSSDKEKSQIKIDNERFYQRIKNDARTASIQQYIIKEAIKDYKFKKGLSNIAPLGLFPTSTLIAMNSYKAANLQEYENKYYNKEKESGNQITLVYIEGNKISLPKGNEIALIVDGQHRIAALKELLPKINDSLKLGKKNVSEIVDSDFFPFLREKIKNFEFLCTLIIDFNIYQQGEIFASVNFNQKPVNRSLYYDIFGSSPNTDKNELKLSHDLVRHLNYSSDSVLNGLIDMLGNGDGVVSQAAMMENLMKLFGQGKCWNLMYMDYRRDGQKYKDLGMFLRVYFKVLKETFTAYWPPTGTERRGDYKYILLKTTGMGAFIRLINDIYPDVNPDFSKSKVLLEEELKLKFTTIAGKGQLYFDKSSAFVQGAGQGLQAKLYKQIAFDLGYRNSPD